MSTKAVKNLFIFGEVLWDCFPNGNKNLGGAPFNVAWNLQGLGASPTFISGVGSGPLGKEVLTACRDWGLSTKSVEIKKDYPTGKVQVQFKDGEPEYDILEEQAYDFITTQALDKVIPDNSILYHGSLALRHDVSRNTLLEMRTKSGCETFVDINIRKPFFNLADISWLLEGVEYVKVNKEELFEITKKDPRKLEVAPVAQKFHEDFDLKVLVVTCGAKGVYTITKEEIFFTPSQKIEEIEDTVGAGDSFSSVFLYGLAHQIPIKKTVAAAVALAAKVCGIEGATSNQKSFYEHIIKK